MSLTGGSCDTYIHRVLATSPYIPMPPSAVQPCQASRKGREITISQGLDSLGLVPPCPLHPLLHHLDPGKFKVIEVKEVT
ncbi:hypothetical protein E2C01_078974 [Portunus trituberculatus]|uniref:Uncharacterized protein n=1 Tax=Portunus trituberculatus TaxID=210409 RepID=A0A5B7IVK3_PORTR|nr:hypothetical protein [Portunus trituberculatus]